MRKKVASVLVVAIATGYASRTLAQEEEAKDERPAKPSRYIAGAALAAAGLAAVAAFASRHGSGGSGSAGGTPRGGGRASGALLRTVCFSRPVDLQTPAYSGQQHPHGAPGADMSRHG